VGARGYPPEFRRKVLDPLEAGRSIAEVAHNLDISEQSIYSWRRQDRIDRGLVPGAHQSLRTRRGDSVLGLRTFRDSV
jgi:transposase